MLKKKKKKKPSRFQILQYFVVLKSQCGKHGSERVKIAELTDPDTGLRVNQQKQWLAYVCRTDLLMFILTLYCIFIVYLI